MLNYDCLFIPHLAWLVSNFICIMGYLCDIRIGKSIMVMLSKKLYLVLVFFSLYEVIYISLYDIGMGGKQYYYVVFVGRIPGIYNTWAACSQQVYGFPRAVYKKYGSWDEANNAWLMDLASSTPIIGNEESIPLLQTIEQSRNEQENSTSSGLSQVALNLLCFLLGATIALLIAFIGIYFLG